MYIRKISTHAIPCGEGVALAAISDSDLRASFDDDGEVLLLDPGTGNEIGVRGEGRWMASDVCAITVCGEVLLAGGCMDGTVQLWNPRTGIQVKVLRGHETPVHAVCEIETGGLHLLASADNSQILLWDPASGELIQTIRDDKQGIGELCAVSVGANSMIAGTSYRKILLWDPIEGDQVGTLEGHSAHIQALCTINANGNTFLASGDSTIDRVEIDRGDVDEGAPEHTVRLWDPVRVEQVRVLEGHSNDVTAVCQISVRGHDLLASAGRDATVRIWNPVSGSSIMTIPVHYSVASITGINDLLVIGLDAGLVAIKINSSQWPALDSCRRRTVTAAVVRDLGCIVRRSRARQRASLTW